MVYPEDYDRITDSIAQQVGATEDQLDYAEYRIIRKDGEIRWVDDYGHYCETKTYGGIYVVFISDITEKREKREEDKAARDAVILALTNSYNTVWLINDVVTESCSLYHTDLDAVHAEAIRNALSHARYTDTKDGVCCHNGRKGRAETDAGGDRSSLYLDTVRDTGPIYRQLYPRAGKRPKTLPGQFKQSLYARRAHGRGDGLQGCG